MLNLRKVAVTGGISSGKTKFCSFLQDLGAYVVSADNVVHQLLSSHYSLRKKVIELLSPKILVDGEIDRTKIAQIVFKDLNLLSSLEKLIHPEVFFQIEKEYEIAKEQSFPLFVAEIPLLFEVKGDRFFDVTVTVKANESICIKRFIQKTKKTETEYRLRMSQQLTQDEKAKKADYLILNNGSEEDLYKEAEKLFEKLSKSSQNQH